MKCCKEVGARGNAAVRIAVINDLIAQGEIPVPDIIKLDIEGAEILALRGMGNLLTSSKAPRFMFIEFHPDFLPAFNSSLDECKQLVKQYGYNEIQSFRRSNQQHYFFKK